MEPRGPSSRIIWSYWEQGVDEAPPLVEACWESWRVRNPGYRVVCLDSSTLGGYLDLTESLDSDRLDLPVQKRASLLRLGLLRRYGGVWIDATVFCARPLDEWLPDHYQTGFFAFRRPSRNRLMSNWLIASEPDSCILERLEEEYWRYFADNRFTFQGNRLVARGVRRLARKLKRPEQTRFWHTAFARKVLRAYPYFIFHYTFNKVIAEDPRCREAWETAKPFPAEGPHRLQSYRRLGEKGVASALRFLAAGGAPVHKLNWRWDLEQPYWDRVLPVLFSLNRAPGDAWLARGAPA